MADGRRVVHVHEAGTPYAHGLHHLERVPRRLHHGRPDRGAPPLLRSHGRGGAGPLRPPAGGRLWIATRHNLVDRFGVDATAALEQVGVDPMRPRKNPGNVRRMGVAPGRECHSRHRKRRSRRPEGGDRSIGGRAGVSVVGPCRICSPPADVAASRASAGPSPDFDPVALFAGGDTGDVADPLPLSPGVDGRRGGPGGRVRWTTMPEGHRAAISPARLLRRQIVLEEHDPLPGGDGAIVVRRFVRAETYRSHLHLVDFGRPGRLSPSAGAVRDTSPRVSSDGRRLAFLRSLPDEPDRSTAVIRTTDRSRRLALR